MIANINELTIVPGNHKAVVLTAVAILFPGQGARVEWQLCTSTMQVVAHGVEEMRGADFEAWGNDDAHVFRWLAPRLGVTITEIFEPAPPAPPVVEEPAPVVEG